VRSACDNGGRSNEISVKLQRDRATPAPPSGPLSASTLVGLPAHRAPRGLPSPMEIGRVAYPAVAPVWAPRACRVCGRYPQAPGPGHAWSHRGYPRSVVRPAAGHTVPLRVRLRLSPVVLPLMPPAPRALLRAVGLQPGGGASCSAVAVRTRDSARAGPHPTPRPVPPNENDKHCSFCSLTVEQRIDDRLQLFAAYHNSIPHRIHDK